MSRYRGCLALLREPRLTAQHTQQSVERVRRQFVNCLFGCVGRPSSSSSRQIMFFASSIQVRLINQARSISSALLHENSVAFAVVI